MLFRGMEASPWLFQIRILDALSTLKLKKYFFIAFCLFLEWNLKIWNHLFIKIIETKIMNIKNRSFCFRGREKSIMPLPNLLLKVYIKKYCAGKKGKTGLIWIN